MTKRNKKSRLTVEGSLLVGSARRGKQALVRLSGVDMSIGKMEPASDFLSQSPRTRSQSRSQKAQTMSTRANMAITVAVLTSLILMLFVGIEVPNSRPDFF